MSSANQSAAQSPPLEILCEDGPVIAVNKPAGIVVQGAPAGVDNLADLVRQYLKRKYDKPGNVYLGVPHRLDRPVTGVVIFSRNSKCAARLSEQFAARQVEKTYRAILERPPQPADGTLVDWLLRTEEDDPSDVLKFYGPKVSVVSEATAGAKPAVLHYQTLATSQGRALVQIHLETGRMHQIRVQFASRGCPILGDTQYGAHLFWDDRTVRAATPSDETRFHPIALHAWRLKLQHPVRYDDLTITAASPANWSQLGFPGD
ncbi:MAG: RluA family pseudouridine synthase [Planctomycetaceae bacterium]